MNCGKVFQKYGCDKDTWHSYGQVYDWLLKDREIKRIVEIGIWEGNSLKSWNELFPNAEIIGLDLNILDKKLFTKNVKMFHLDQSNRDHLQEFVNAVETADLIIDDGSHWVEHQLLSYEMLSPMVKETNGLYVIEDLQIGNQDMTPIFSLPNATFIDRRRVKDRYDDFMVVFDYKGEDK